MSNKHIAIICFSVFACLLVVWGYANADDRINRIQLAWNAGDTVATQQDFNREEYDDMIRLAQLAEKGGTLVILDKKLVMEQPELGNVYAVRAEVNGERQVWLLQDCGMDTTRWCYFSARPEPGEIGGMEAGQAADIGTTAVALTAIEGLAEGNPLGLGGAGLIKTFAIMGSRHAEFQQCLVWRTSYDATGWGAGAANVLTMIGAPFPLSLAVMAATTFARFEEARVTAWFECAKFALDGTVRPSMVTERDGMYWPEGLE